MISLGDSTFPQQMRMTREEKDEIAEILRILAEKPQQFRLQFMGVSSAADSNVQNEKTIWVPDAPTAVSVAVDVPLPAEALGVRVVDQRGCTVFERQKGVRSLDGSQVARLSAPSTAPPHQPPDKERGRLDRRTGEIFADNLSVVADGREEIPGGATTAESD